MIIGLTGLMGSGKDTAADAIMKEFPEFQRYALAGPIKELADAWLGINPDYLQRGVKESLVAFEIGEPAFECLDIIVYEMFKDRHSLMDMPTAKKVSKAIYNAVMKDHMFSNVNHAEVIPDVLVTTPRRILQIIGTEGFRDTVSDTFWLDIAPTEDAVITDIRFPNEAAWYAVEENALIEIVRDSLKKPIGAVHQSEQGIPSELVTQCIYNDQTIEHLQFEVVKFVTEHLKINNYNMRN